MRGLAFPLAGRRRQRIDRVALQRDRHSAVDHGYMVPGPKIGLLDELAAGVRMPDVDRAGLQAFGQA